MREELGDHDEVVFNVEDKGCDQVRCRNFFHYLTLLDNVSNYHSIVTMFEVRKL